jgi:hypothetical protein
MFRPIINLVAIIGLLGLVVRLAPSRAHSIDQCLSPIADVEISARTNR